MNQSFNATWRALIKKNDVAKAKKKYAVEVLAQAYLDRLEAAGGKRERAKVGRLLSRCGVVG